MLIYTLYNGVFARNRTKRVLMYLILLMFQMNYALGSCIICILVLWLGICFWAPVVWVPTSRGIRSYIVFVTTAATASASEATSEAPTSEGGWLHTTASVAIFYRILLSVWILYTTICTILSTWLSTLLIMYLSNKCDV